MIVSEKSDPRLFEYMCHRHKMAKDLVCSFSITPVMKSDIDDQTTSRPVEGVQGSVHPEDN